MPCQLNANIIPVELQVNRNMKYNYRVFGWNVFFRSFYSRNWRVPSC